MSILHAVLDDLESNPAGCERLRALLADESSSQLLTPVEAAQKLGIHEKTLTRAAADGRVTGAVRAGRHWRFNPAALALAPISRGPLGSVPPARRTAPSVAADAIRGER